MLVIREDLVKAGCQQNQSWFDRRLKGEGYKVVDGKLWVTYSLKNIKTQIQEYLKSLSKKPHVRRHGSFYKCEDLLKAIKEIECNQYYHS